MARRVLVVEDHPDGREMLRFLIQVWGHDVQVADDGPDGVQAALAWRPDVAIVDIGLPGLNGFEVALQVRAALHGRITLIALTAYCQPEDRRRAFEAGFDHFLAKPADPVELARLVQEAPAR